LRKVRKEGRWGGRKEKRGGILDFRGLYLSEIAWGN
jgi:hypothetical protein